MCTKWFYQSFFFLILKYSVHLHQKYCIEKSFFQTNLKFSGSDLVIAFDIMNRLFRTLPTYFSPPLAELRFKTMKWVRKNRKGIFPGCKSEWDGSLGGRHAGRSHSTRWVLFLPVAKHVSEFVSMCLGTLGIMWLMIRNYEKKSCRLTSTRTYLCNQFGCILYLFYLN